MREEFIGDVPWPPHAAKGLGNGKSGLQAVLMKSGTEICSAEPSIALTLQGPQLLLRPNRRRIEQRMLVHLVVPGLTRLPWRIEGDEQLRMVRKVLQRVHPVGHRWTGLGIAAVMTDVVPARPYRASLRHQGGIGVQDRSVATIAKGAQQPLFLRRRIAQQGQRLIRMGGDHHVIERLRPARCCRGS